jgi:hypothetical protein
MGRMTNVFRSLVGTVTGETEKAVRFQIDVATEEHMEPIMKAEWFPKSQLASFHRMNGLGTDVIMASEWILREKGWLDFAGAAGYNPAVSTVIAQQIVPVATNPNTLYHDSLIDKLKTPPVKPRCEMDDDVPF